MRKSIKLKYSLNIKRLFKETIWIVLGQVILILGSIYLIKVLTNLLSLKEYGTLSLLLTINGFFVQSLFSSITPGATRFYSEATRRNELGSYLHSLVESTKFLSKIIVFISLAIVTILFFLKIKQFSIYIAIIAFVYSSLNGYVSIFNAVQQANRKHNVVSFNQSLDSIFKIIFSISLIYLFAGKSYIVLVAFTLSSFIIFFLNLSIIKKEYNRLLFMKDELIYWKKKIWDYSWPFVMWGIFSAVQLYSDRWSLKIYTNDSEIGLYTVIYQFGFTLMTTASGVFIALLTPIIFQKIEDESSESINKITKNILIIGLAISIMAFVFTIFTHELMFYFFIDERYAKVSYLLPWMILSGGINSVGQAYSLILMAKKKVLTLLPIKVVTSIVGIMLNIIGAKILGIKGVVIANLIFSFIFLLSLYIITNNEKSLKNIELK